jgi:hypothetical protein
MKETEGRKSRATVPLRRWLSELFYIEHNYWEGGFSSSTIHSVYVVHNTVYKIFVWPIHFFELCIIKYKKKAQYFRLCGLTKLKILNKLNKMSLRTGNGAHLTVGVPAFCFVFIFSSRSWKVWKIGVAIYKKSTIATTTTFLLLRSYIISSVALQSVHTV